MKAPEPGLVVIHGHFYQPPRENPWTGEVDAEPSAAPDHDWNVRVTRETYEPLVSVEIEDGGKRIKVPVYEYLSFDFGPTLLDWMEREAREIHDVVIRADRVSVERLGHGNALAMPYHISSCPSPRGATRKPKFAGASTTSSAASGETPWGFGCRKQRSTVNRSTSLPRRGLRSPCSHRIRSRACPSAAAP